MTTFLEISVRPLCEWITFLCCLKNLSYNFNIKNFHILCYLLSGILSTSFHIWEHLHYRRTKIHWTLSLRFTTCVDLNIDHLSVNICLRRPELSKGVCVSLRFVMRTLSLSGGFIANFFIGGFSRTFGIVMEEFQKIFDCQSAYLTLAGGLIYTFMYTMCKLRNVTALRLGSFWV